MWIPQVHKSDPFLSLGLTLFILSCKLIIVKFKRRNTAALVSISFVSCVLLSYLALLRSLEVEPVRWLLRFVTHSRGRVSDEFINQNLEYSQSFPFGVISEQSHAEVAGLLLLNVLFAAFWTRTTTGSAGPKIRKIFHLGISAVFVIGIKEDPELLSFCSACLLLIFLVLEVSRSQHASFTDLLSYSSVLANLQAVASSICAGTMCFCL